MKVAIGVLALALVSFSVPGTRAGANTVTISFDGMPPAGKQVANWLTWNPQDRLTWFTMPVLTADALGIGSSNPYYAGSPGIDFGDTWDLLPTDYPPFVQVPVRFESITMTLAMTEPATAPISLSGQVFDTAPPIAVGPAWTWQVASPGTYFEDLGGVSGDDLHFGATGFWQVTSITIVYEPSVQAAPEPAGITLATIAAACCVIGLRRHPGFSFARRARAASRSA